jgi:hypothetical protein
VDTLVEKGPAHVAVGVAIGLLALAGREASARRVDEPDDGCSCRDRALGEADLLLDTLRAERAGLDGVIVAVKNISRPSISPIPVISPSAGVRSSAV